MDNKNIILMFDEDWTTYLKKQTDNKIDDNDIKILLRAVSAYISRRTGVEVKDFGDDLLLAVAALVKYTVTKPDGLASKNFGDVSFSFENDIPEIVKEIISQYDEATLYPDNTFRRWL